ncbi:hypothetical protein [Gracilibacillus saliphilus]|uniref:hypothetical protein n=1 Tax=Gracilibacillus saliphilus TaxID=543890 RepID=UPI0013D2FEAC|nr:hypothetical protein [Gracilibacillus saliphilus]
MKKNWKKLVRRFLLLLIGIYMLYSLYTHLEYRHYIKQSIEGNYQYLEIISEKGDNLADWIEEFANLKMENQENSEVDSELFYAWRVVKGESKSIHSYLYAISTLHTDEEESSAWDLLKFSLIRTDEFITQLTNKFLENHSYAINSEDQEKIEAVITVYRTINEEVEGESINLEKILEDIEKPMNVIYDDYPGILERTGK